VYWLRRPPIGRLALAALLIALGLYTEFAPATTVPHPFTGSATEAGQPIDSIVWRDVPAGLFQSIDWPTEGPIEGPNLIAKIDLSPGTPLIPDLLGQIAAPPDWWSLVIELPGFLDPGTRLAILPEPDGTPIEGLVLASTPPDELTYGAPSGLVAVEPEGATAVARGAASGSLIVLLMPPSR